ncbi:MAG TPA: 3-hydroxyacyl-ACP dehydratase [Chitinophagales bacterium]
MITTINAPLEKILPQRNPFILISALNDYSETTAVTTFVIAENHLLVENGTLNEAGLLENMAQTAAAQLGYKALLNGIVAPLGFIAAVKNFEVISYPKIGQKIETKIAYVNVVLNIQVVNAEVFLCGEKIASAELKIFIHE